MNINDFRFMRKGKQMQLLTPADAHLLQPIDRRSTLKNRALLLLHGFTSTPGVYREMLPLLSMYAAIVCPALPGHADSIVSFNNVKAAEWVTASEQVCQSLIQEYQAVDVLGLSLGGLLGCHLSTRFNLNHLYLLAPALALPINIPLLLWYGRILSVMGIKYLRNRAGNLHTQRSRELAYRLLPVHAATELLTLIQDYKFDPPSCPADLFLGRWDTVIDSMTIAKAFENFPHTQIHWLENSAHVIPLEEDISAIITCIEKNWGKAAQS